VFSAFGTVQKIAMFEKNGGMQALIQYPGMLTQLHPTVYTLALVNPEIESLAVFIDVACSCKLLMLAQLSTLHMSCSLCLKVWGHEVFSNYFQMYCVCKSHDVFSVFSLIYPPPPQFFVNI
jgi:hypothetical protein